MCSVAGYTDFIRIVARRVLDIHLRRLMGSASAVLAELNGWAGHGAERTEDAAVTFLGLDDHSARGTRVEADAGIHRHLFLRDPATFGAC